MLNYKILAVIPARGGSKGIKRKNIRYVAGKPLIYYAINAAIRSKYINAVYVTSEDDEILRIAKLLGAKAIKRPYELANDDVPLDPVIHHAVNFIETESNVMYDIVITLQPTVPLITSNDIDNAIEMLIKNKFDTIIFAVDASHLYWIKNSQDGVWRPLFKKRSNRQYLPSIARELGVLITWRKYIKENNRLGTRVGIYLIPEERGIDIDTSLDMLMAEILLQRLNVIFVVDGKRNTGLGHIYRSLTIAERLRGHNILFLTNGELGKQLIERWGYNVRIVKSYSEIIRVVSSFKPNLVINDILDTSEEYMRSLRKAVDAIIVNFEDLGNGSMYADLVFNALYEFSSPPPNHYYGYKYFILRDEFRLFPIKKYNENMRLTTMTIIFGGVDINNLTKLALNAIENLGLKDIFINVIVGPGYKHRSELSDYVDNLLSRGYKVKLHDTPNFIADIINSSDLVITSNGRTIYEVVSFAIPAISIAQNERELKHPFVYINKGVRFIGLASTLTVDTIADTIRVFAQNPRLLFKYNKMLHPYAIDIRQGIKRVMRIILDKVSSYGKD